MSEKQIPPDFVDPRKKLALNEVPLLNIEDLPRAPVSDLTPEHYHQAVISVDSIFVAPIVEKIAKAVGVNVIDDEFYSRVVPVTDKSSSLFIIRNRARVFHDSDKGYSEWEGIQVRVKGLIVAGVWTRAYASNKVGAFLKVRLYDRRIEDYIYLVADSEGKKCFTPDYIPQTVMNYLEQEGIIQSRLIVL